MKKTLIALLALGCMAVAEEYNYATYNLLTDEAASWDLGAYSKAAPTIDGGVLTVNAHWGKAYAYYDLSETAITLTDKQSVVFTYTLGVLDKSDVCATVVLGTTNGVLASGLATYNGGSNKAPIMQGYTTNPSAQDALFISLDKASAGADYDFSSSELTSTGVAVENYTNYVISQKIQWNANQGAFTSTISVDGVEMGSLSLGSDVTLDHIAVSIAGNTTNYVSVPKFSGMTLAYTPEPATATLSLLALAGLAARRRRH